MTLQITAQWLDDHIARATYCSTATIPRAHFDALMDMAMRLRGYETLGLRALRERLRGEDEVTLTGNELRGLLMLAKHARRLRPQLRGVPARKQN
jgi:hypothetical protein